MKRVRKKGVKEWRLKVRKDIAKIKIIGYNTIKQNEANPLSDTNNLN